MPIEPLLGIYLLILSDKLSNYPQTSSRCTLKCIDNPFELKSNDTPVAVGLSVFDQFNVDG